jgi:ABC-type multidrug transport system fused ATPase/permease subunit
MTPAVVLVVASIGAGLSEAGVLALVASVAAAMVSRAHRLSTVLGPLSLHIRIGEALGLALGLACFRLILQLAIAVLPSKISADVQARMRHDLVDTFTRASWAVQSQEGEGHLQELMSTQVLLASQIVIQIVSALSGCVMFLALVAVAFALSPSVALIVLLSAFALFWVLRPLSRFAGRAGREMSQTNLDQAAAVSETVRLAEEAQVFGGGAGQREILGRLIADARRAFFRYVFSGGVITSVYQSLVIILIVGGLGGLYFTHAGNIAALGAVVLMLVRASNYAQQFQGGFQSFAQILPYLDRLQTAVATYSASTPAPGHEPLPMIESLAFESVSFSYRHDRPALSHVTFEARAGEAIGIVGPSGSGKSTLTQLLLRLREPDEGAVLVNGEPATVFLRQDWERRVAYVSQEPRIMTTTVAENIRFFRDMDRVAIERAARAAHVHDDIMRLPAGYDTVIGQRADAVSGGQRQRICLARALAGDPDVLVLDEPTSALDMTSEVAVQASLAKLHGTVTLFIVAHRMSTLTNCDRILVLAAGRVEGYGPLTELQSSSSYYRATAELTRKTAAPR